jgi:hypothetical protein
VYNLAAQTVAIESAVTFDSNGVLTPGITHATGTAGISLTDAGVYVVTYSVSATALSQMTLFINGVALPDTTYGSGAGTQQNTGQAIITAASGDVLTLRNHTTSAAVALATPIGGTAPTVNAFLLIEELG